MNKRPTAYYTGHSADATPLIFRLDMWIMVFGLSCFFSLSCILKFDH